MAIQTTATHVVVTADDLDRSRVRRKAKTYFYKDIHLDRLQAWRAQSLMQREVGVCRTTILECVDAANNMRP